MIIWDSEGNGTLYQGDSDILKIENLNTDYNWTVYFSIYDKNHRTIGTEQHSQSNYGNFVEIEIPHTLTDLLTVPKNNEFETYYYGVKGVRIENGRIVEDTFFVGSNNDFSVQNTLTVYPRKAKGST